MEQILPAKANKQDVSQQIAAKANLFDIKSTMAEVAANIESKVSIETMQEKVSYDDMKRYVALNAGAGANSGDQKSPLANRQFEVIDEELRKLKEKVEDTYHQVQSLRQLGGGPSS